GSIDSFACNHVSLARRQSGNFAPQPFFGTPLPGYGGRVYGKETSMEIGERRIGSLLVLRPEGRVDNTTSPAFQARLLDAIKSEPSGIVVDFSAVDYVSSAGLRALMTAAKLKPKELRLAAIGLNSVVQEIFTISRFHHVVPVLNSLEEAAGAGEARPQPGESENEAEQAESTIRLHFWG